MSKIPVRESLCETREEQMKKSLWLWIRFDVVQLIKQECATQMGMSMVGRPFKYKGFTPRKPRN
jgi:hypothetical protein